jgi:pyruvate dehydrogenase E2 component (dihydrolipoamide acetyltransferase)
VSTGARVFASPLARRLAAQAGIDIGALRGSGPHGRIVQRDVEAATASGAPPRPAATAATAQAAPPASPIDYRAFFADGTYEEVPLDNMRKTIARRLTASKRDIPHFYLTIDCRIDALLEARKKLNALGDQYRISVNDFVIKACGLALRKVPAANATWAETHILRHSTADISMAVAIEGGLITPIVRSADTKGLAEIAAEAKDLAARARDRKLQPSEYEGGTFSVSNLGMFGIRDFTAVINPPQAAILAVGAGERRAVVTESGTIEAATVMTVTLSCDHRVIDGALGAQLLAAFKGYIEDPVTMLL